MFKIKKRKKKSAVSRAPNNGNNSQKNTQRRRMHFETLEPRILLSSDIGIQVPDMQDGFEPALPELHSTIIEYDLHATEERAADNPEIASLHTDEGPVAVVTSDTATQLVDAAESANATTDDIPSHEPAQNRTGVIDESVQADQAVQADQTAETDGEQVSIARAHAEYQQLTREIIIVDSSVPDHASLLDSIVENIKSVNGDEDGSAHGDNGNGVDAELQAPQNGGPGTDQTDSSGHITSYNDASLPVHDNSIITHDRGDNGSDKNVKIFVLDPDRDGIEQISEILEQASGLGAVHILSHGTAGQIRLGNTHVDKEKLKKYADELKGWGNVLTEEGDILLYGCNVAEGETGVEFVESLAAYTKSDVAASTDDTGSSDLGGDWQLELSTGVIESQIPFTSQVLNSYAYLLADYDGNGATPLTDADNTNGDDKYFFSDGWGDDDVIDGAGHGVNGDTLDFSGVTDANTTLTFTITGTDGSLTVEDGNGNSMTAMNIENLIGGNGDNSFIFDDGASLPGSINGGTGSAILDYSNYSTSVTVDLSLGTAAGTSGISNIQNVTGGSGADVITGDDNSNILTGGGGNDVLTGGADDDTLKVILQDGNTVAVNGGEGSDTLTVDASGNTPTFQLNNISVNEAIVNYNDETEDVSVINVALSENDREAIKEVLLGMVDLGTTLSDTGDFAKIMPLTGNTLGDLIDADAVFRDLHKWVSDFLAVGVTSEQLKDRLAAWSADDVSEDDSNLGEINVTVDAIVLDSVINVVQGGTAHATQELVFDMAFKTQRTSTYDLEDAEELLERGIVLDDSAGGDNAAFDFTSGFSFSFSFGDEYGVADSGFAETGTLNAAAQFDNTGSPSEQFNTGARVGFLGGRIENGTLDYDFTVDATFDDPTPVDSRLTTANDDFSNATTSINNAAGTLDLTLPFSVNASDFVNGDAPDTSEPIMLSDVNGNFFNDGVELNLHEEELEELDVFNLITPNDLLGMLDQLGDWYADLSLSPLLDLEIPFTDDVDVGGVIDFATAFRDDILRHLVNHDGLQVSSIIRDTGRLSEDAVFSIAVTEGQNEPALYTVIVTSESTRGNNNLDDLVEDIQNALDDALPDTIEDQVEAFRSDKSDRIEIRPKEDATTVNEVAISLVNNETLVSNGGRLLIPQSVMDTGVLEHRINFVLNIDGEETLIPVERDVSNKNLVGPDERLNALISDVQQAVDNAVTTSPEGVNARFGESGVIVELTGARGNEISFRPFTIDDLRPGQSEDDLISIGSVRLADASKTATLSLADPDGDEVLGRAELSLGLESATFPTAQELADQLNEILSGLVDDHIDIKVRFDYDGAGAKEISFDVNWQREYDLASIPIDFNMDLGDFANVTSTSELGVTATVDLGFTFGVDFTATPELVIAPPVFQPDLPADGKLTTVDDNSTLVDANFDFAIYQRNFDPEDRLSSEVEVVDGVNVGGLGFDGDVLIPIGGSSSTGWTPPAEGRLAEGQNLGFALRVDPTDAGAKPEIVYGFVKDTDTETNSSSSNLAEDISFAMNNALGSFGIQVTVSGDDNNLLFTASSDPNSNYQAFAILDTDEFLVDKGTIIVPASETSNNDTVGDLVADVRTAMDRALLDAGTHDANEVLGFGEVTLTTGTDASSAPFFIGGDTAPRDGVLLNNLRFAIEVDNGDYVFGVVRASDTVGNDSIDDPGDDPVAALAENVQAALRQSIGNDNIIVNGHPTLGVASISLNNNQVTASSAAPADGKLVEDLAFQLTVNGQSPTEEIFSAVRVKETVNNSSADALAADVEAAINDALADENITVSVTVNDEGKLVFSSTAELTIDFSDNPSRRLEMQAIGTVADVPITINFFRPNLVAENAGNRISIGAPPVTVQPDEEVSQRLLGRRVEISTDFTDPAYKELGVLSSPVPFDGVLTGTANFTLIVDDVEHAITVNPDANNDSIDDLIDDINQAINFEFNNDIDQEAIVQARRVLSNVIRNETLTDEQRENLAKPTGNRIEFFVAGGEGVKSLGLRMVERFNTDSSDNTAVTQLGFDTENDTEVRSKADPFGSFFLENTGLTGTLELSPVPVEAPAHPVEARAQFGFLDAFGSGDQGLGIGVDAGGDGSVTGEVRLRLVDPDNNDNPRVTLRQLWEKIGTGELDEIRELVKDNITGEASFVLNVEPDLPLSTPIDPAVVSLDLVIDNWLDSPPVLDDSSSPNSVNVNITGLDLNIYDSLRNLSFSDVIDGLNDVVAYLRDLQGAGDSTPAGEAFDFLVDTELPLVNQSVSDLLVVAEDFSLMVDELTANPVDSIQLLERAIEDLLGLAEDGIDSPFVDLSFDFEETETMALRLDLMFTTGIDASYGLDLDFIKLLEQAVGPNLEFLKDVSSLVGVSSTGDLSVSVEGVARISLGIGLGAGNGSAEALGFKNGASNESTSRISDVGTPGVPLEIQITATELNTVDSAVETAHVNVVNDITGETEIITLTETGEDTSVFEGILTTTDLEDDDGAMHTREDDTLTVHYDVQVNGSTETRKVDINDAGTPGVPLEIEITATELNTDDSVAETADVEVVNDSTGETEIVTLTETGPATRVFKGTLQTLAQDDNDDSMDTREDDTLTVIYDVGGPLTATGDAQAAADRLVDQDIEFLLTVGDAQYAITVMADETENDVAVKDDTKLRDVNGVDWAGEDSDPPSAPPVETLTAHLREGDDPNNPFEIILNLQADASIVDFINAINTDSANGGKLVASLGVDNDGQQRIILKDKTNGSNSGASQTGPLVFLRGVDEGSDLSFSLRVGGGSFAPDAFNVAVDVDSGLTRAEWLAEIREQIRKAMVKAGQLNPVEAAAVDVTYNGGIEQLSFAGTGEALGKQLTISAGSTNVFSVESDLSDGLLADLGLIESDGDNDGEVTSIVLRTGEPKPSSPVEDSSLVKDIRTALTTATLAGSEPKIKVDLSTMVSVSDINISGQPRLQFEAIKNSDSTLLKIESAPGGVSAFLYDGETGTKLGLEAELKGENLEFTAQVGPFGFFVLDGMASLKGEFAVFLEDGDNNGRHYFGQNEKFLEEVEVKLDGSAEVDLPLFFPTETNQIGETPLIIEIESLAAFLRGEDGSVFIDTPDLTAFPTPTLIGMLSNPEFVIDGLDSVLSTVQDALDAAVDVDVPLIGDQLSSATNFIGDFREDVLSYLSIKLRQGGLNPVTLVQETLFNIFADEGDGDAAALTVLGFDNGQLAEDGVLTALNAADLDEDGLLTGDARFNLTINDDFTELITVSREDMQREDLSGIDGLVKALNISLFARGMSDRVEAGNSGNNVVLRTKNGQSLRIKRAGAIPLEIGGLSFGSLGLLKDFDRSTDTDNDLVDINDVFKNGFGLFDEYGQFDMLLGQSFTYNQPIDFDIGLPALGLELDADVELFLDWEMDFGFGVDQTVGFYFATEFQPNDEDTAATVNDADRAELRVNAGAELTGDQSAELLGFSNRDNSAQSLTGDEANLDALRARGSRGEDLMFRLTRTVAGDTAGSLGFADAKKGNGDSKTLTASDPFDITDLQATEQPLEFRLTLADESSRDNDKAIMVSISSEKLKGISDGSGLAAAINSGIADAVAMANAGLEEGEEKTTFDVTALFENDRLVFDYSKETNAKSLSIRGERIELTDIITLRAKDLKDLSDIDSLVNIINIALDGKTGLLPAEAGNDDKLTFKFENAESMAIRGGPASARGVLGFLAVDAVDQGVAGVNLDFTVDLMDPGTDDDKLSFSELVTSGSKFDEIFAATVDGGAEVELGIEVNFANLGLDATLLPNIGLDLIVNWDFLNVDTSTDTTEFGGTPEVSYKNIELDLGSFISDFAGSFLNDLGEFLEPFDFLLDREDGLLYKRLPVISDLSGETINLKRLIEISEDLKDTLGIKHKKISPFLNAVEEIYYFINLVTDAAADAKDGNLVLKFGDLELPDLRGRSDLKDVELSQQEVDDLKKKSQNEVNNLPSGGAKKFTKNLTKPGKGSFDFPILTDPSSIYNLLLGKPDDVTLVTYDLPPFGFDFDYMQIFPIYPPLNATLRGFFSSTIDLAFGYDALGLSQFQASENPLDLINGFFVSDIDLQTGEDIPELTFYGGIAAGANLSIGIASAGVEGGIDVTLFMDLNDPNFDGKVRLGEMEANLILNSFNPLAVFDPSGHMDAFLRAYLQILLFEFSYEIARVTLVEFDFQFDRPPLQGQLNDGELLLNVGTSSENRYHGDTRDIGETIFAETRDGSVYVWGAGGLPKSVAQRFIGVEKIVAYGGEGDDTIDLSGVTGIETEIYGGLGNDTIIGGQGRNVIYGGEGDDRLVGGTSRDELYGEEGLDVLTAGGGNDLLFGGDDDDVLKGEAGNDELDGGMGADELDGGIGDDIYLFAGDWGEDTVIENTDIAGGNDTWDFTETRTDIDFQLGADAGINAVETITVKGDALQVTSVRHGLKTGDVIMLSGIRDSGGLVSELTGIYTVRVVDRDAFMISPPQNGNGPSGNYDENSGIFQLHRTVIGVQQRDIDEVLNAGTAEDPGEIQIILSNHNFDSGDQVRVTGIRDNQGDLIDLGGDGSYTIEVIDDNSFNLAGTFFDAAQSYMAATGIVEYHSRASGVRNGDVISAFVLPNGVLRIQTVENHRLDDRQQVSVTGLVLAAPDGTQTLVEGEFAVTVVDDDFLDLNDSSFDPGHTYVEGTGMFRSFPVYVGVVADVQNTGDESDPGKIRIVSAGHGLSSGEVIATGEVQAAEVIVSGNVQMIEIEADNHGLRSGDRVEVRELNFNDETTGDTVIDGVFEVTAATTDTFTIIYEDSTINPAAEYEQGSGSYGLLSAGDRVTIEGLVATVNGDSTSTFNVTVVDQNTFDLDDTTFDPGVEYPVGTGVLQIKQEGRGLIIGIDGTITSVDHGLQPGDEVVVYGVEEPDANGIFTVESVNGDTFTLAGVANYGGKGVFQLTNTSADSVGNTVDHNGYGIEVIKGGRGGDIYEIYQTGSSTVLLNGQGGSERYIAYSANPAVVPPPEMNVMLKDIGNLWDRDVSIFFGSQGDDDLIVTDQTVTALFDGGAEQSFQYGSSPDPDPEDIAAQEVLGFAQAQNNIDKIIANNSLSSGELDRVARFDLTINNDDPVIVVVEPDSVGGNRTIDDLVDALNESLGISGLGSLVKAGRDGDKLTLEYIVEGQTAEMKIEATVIGSGIEALEVLAQAGNDNVTVESTSENTSVIVSGELGDDDIIVGNNSNGVDDILGTAITGPLIIKGNEGFNTLLVDDSPDESDNSGTLSNEKVSGLDMQVDIEYEDIDFVEVRLGQGDDEFTVLNTIEGETVVKGNGGVDRIDVQKIAGKTTIKGGADDDTINVGVNELPPVTVKVNLDGVDENVGDLVDRLNRALENTSLAEKVEFGQEGEIVTLETTGAEEPAALSILPTDNTSPAVELLGFIREGQSSNGSSADPEALMKAGTLPDFDNFPGSLSFEIIANLSPGGKDNVIVGGIEADLIVNGEGGDDILNVDDSGQTEDNRGFLTNSTINFDDMPGEIIYDTLEAINIFLGTGHDEFNVLSSAQGAVSTIDGNDGDDMFHVSSSAPSISGTLDGIAGELLVLGGSGANMLNISDLGSDEADPDVLLSRTVLTGLFTPFLTTTDAAVNDNDITAERLTGLAPAAINFSAEGTFGRGINVWAGTNDDSITVESTHKDSITLIYGNNGDDTFLVDKLNPDDHGRLAIFGEQGKDTVDASSSSLGIIMTGDSGEVLFHIGKNNESVLDSVGTRNPSKGDTDTLTGGSGDDIMLGGAAGDSVSGNSGDDILLGDNGRVDFNENGTPAIVRTTSSDSGGDDTIDAGNGDNIIFGGSGSDDITTSGSGTNIAGGDNGSAEFDKKGLPVSIESQLAGGDDDVMNGSAGRDYFIGGPGADRLSGGPGDDILIGDDGLMRFQNGLPLTAETTNPFSGGADFLDGGEDNDIMLGGADSDIFVGDFSDDIMIGEYARVTFDGDVVEFVVRLGQYPLDLIGNRLFGLYGSPFTSNPLILSVISIGGMVPAGTSRLALISELAGAAGAAAGPPLSNSGSHVAAKGPIYPYTKPTEPMPKIEETDIHQVPAEETEAPMKEYRVKEGDTLWEIAEEQLGDPLRWQEILQLNPEISDGDLIYPGQIIKVPRGSSSPDVTGSGDDHEENSDLAAVAAGIAGWSTCRSSQGSKRSALTPEAFRKLDEEEYSRRFIKW